MYLKLHHALFDELNADGGTGGGGGDTGIDIEKTVDSFAKDLGLTEGDGDGKPAISSSDTGDVAAPAKGPSGESTTTLGPDGKPVVKEEPKLGADGKPIVDATLPVVKPAPKSWAADKHDVWAKAAAVPGLQEQIEHREQQMLEGLGRYKAHAEYASAMDKVIGPFRDHLRALGVKDETQAVQTLLAAQVALSDRDPVKRAGAFAKLAKDYKLSIETLTQHWGDEPAYVDPRLTGLETRLNKFEQGQVEEQQRALATAKAKSAKEVEDFANDPKHPYFDECATDIALYCQAGHTLADAYDKAVMANSVTRAKELARISKETEERIRKEADENAKKALKAKGANGSGRETDRRPTDPLGTIDDTLSDTLKNIKARNV